MVHAVIAALDVVVALEGEQIQGFRFKAKGTGLGVKGERLGGEGSGLQACGIPGQAPDDIVLRLAVSISPVALNLEPVALILEP
jgi:hypothetical protein